MFRVAITDYTFPTLEVEEGILQAAGCEIVSGQCKTPESLIPLVADADAVITQFAPVNADIVAAMQKASHRAIRNRLRQRGPATPERSAGIPSATSLTTASMRSPITRWDSFWL